jgi:hypothetical protein
LKKFKVFDKETEECTILKSESKQDFNNLLNRLHINIFHKDDMSEILSFEDIAAESSSDFSSGDYKYVSLPTIFHKKLDNANNKTLAWTESLESEAGHAIEELIGSTLIPANDELFNKSHRFQVFAQNTGKKETIKERDGLLFSIEHDVAFVISVKARFGEKEKMSC